MLLTKFRVTEFRSVQDSGWIDAEQVTALIGTNESGKTNVMLPLWKLNPAEDGKIDLQDDLGQFTRNYTQTTKRGLLTTNKG